jgi:MOSC domain-containing protein YiiM
MQVVSVNIGRAQSWEKGRKSGKTGIYKTPVSGPVAITALGVGGDTVCNKKHHGGPDQAVYVYGSPDYAWWSERLGRELSPGTFGENLTLSELESASVAIGDRFVIGPVVLEVTAPRIPCATLARRMEDPSFVKQFMEAERPGVYCRVLQEGAVQAGDAVTWQPYSGDRLTALELFRYFYEDADEATLRRILAAPIALRARAYKEGQLQELLARKAGT